MATTRGKKKTTTKKRGTAEKTALPASVNVGGDGKYDETDANVGGGARVANRNGIFRATYSKPPKIGWFVPVKAKPDQVNFVFRIKTDGPGDEDEGFECTTYKNISTEFGESSKRVGQSQVAWVRDALMSVGISREKVVKMVPLKGDVVLAKLAAYLDKYVDGKTGYVKLLASEDREPYQGVYQCTSKVIAAVVKAKALARIEEGTHESDFSPVVKKFLDGKPRTADGDDDEDNDIEDDEGIDDEDDIEEDEDDLDEDEDEDDDDFDDDDDDE